MADGGTSMVPEREDNPERAGVSVGYNPDTLNTFVADLIHFEVADEYVVMNLAQRAPANSQPGLSDQAAEYKLVARYAISWPHFKRMTDSAVKAYREQRERVHDFMAAELS